jgi:ADYC domain
MIDAPGPFARIRLELAAGRLAEARAWLTTAVGELRARRRVSFPVPGRATAHGTVAAAEPGVFELTCTGGAQAKCVRVGYRPWETSTDGRPMRVLYNTCVRMMRADYGGDGHGTTRDGMLIDVYDAWKIQTPDLQEE